MDTADIYFLTFIAGVLTGVLAIALNFRFYKTENIRIPPRPKTAIKINRKVNEITTERLRSERSYETRLLNFMRSPEYREYHSERLSSINLRLSIKQTKQHAQQ